MSCQGLSNQPLKVSLENINKRKRNILISKQSIFTEDEATDNYEENIITCTNLSSSIEEIIDLKDEGCDLAESGEFGKAINIFNKALSKFSLIITTSENEAKNNFVTSTLYELKAQAYLELNYILQAVSDAKLAISFSPKWAIAHLTLARFIII